MLQLGMSDSEIVVSTHSRPKAAGFLMRVWVLLLMVSTHSRPKAAGAVSDLAKKVDKVSTHSRPKAAGRFLTA